MSRKYKLFESTRTSGRLSYYVFNQVIFFVLFFLALQPIFYPARAGYGSQVIR